jgi:hypothetical protein
VVQAQGEGLTIETALLSQRLRHSESLRLALMSQEPMIYAHTQQIVACNAVHRLEERLCRWLLQTRDLIMSETLPLTQF